MVLPRPPVKTTRPDFRILRTVGAPITWRLEAETSRDLEVEVAREEDELREIKDIEGIEGVGEVEEISMGPIRRKKSGVQNGCMSIRPLFHFYPD